MLSNCCADRELPFDDLGCEILEGYMVMSGMFAGMEFDVTAAAECIGHLEARVSSCQWIDGDGPCERMFFGTLPEGAPCTSDYDCASVEGANVDCYAPSDTESDPNSTVCVVTPRGKLKEPCDGDCSLHEGIFGGSIGCVSFPGPADGVTCWNIDGLYCDEETFTCAARLSEGQPCMIDDMTGIPCLEGLYCDRALSTPVCVPTNEENDDFDDVCRGI